MKKLTTVSVLMMFFMPLCFSEDNIHIVKKGEVTVQSVSCRRMTDRLNQAAAMYAKIGGVARIGVYDFAFGADMEEYKKLNSYGVIMISSQCHNERELPLKDAYFKAGDKHYRLVFLFGKPVKTSGDAAEKVFGTNRNDSFYLIPYAFTRMKGDVCVDWGKNRKGFIVAKFPGTMTLDFMTSDKDIMPDKNGRIAAETLGKFLEREFSFSALETKQAIKKMGETAEK